MHSLYLIVVNMPAPCQKLYHIVVNMLTCIICYLSGIRSSRDMVEHGTKTLSSKRNPQLNPTGVQHNLALPVADFC